MKNQLLALTAGIGVSFIGCFTPRLELLPVQAMTVENRNGIIVIGIGQTVRTGDRTVTVQRGTKVYFECRDKGGAYNAIKIMGNGIDAKLDQFNSRSSVFIFNNKGQYSYQITNTVGSFNETITLIVQ